MERALKQRLIGAAVLIAIAVIFLPMLVKGPAPVSGAADVSLEVPKTPQDGFETRDLPLGTPGQVPVGGIAGLADAPAATAASAASAATAATPAPASSQPGMAAGDYAVAFGHYATAEDAGRMVTALQQAQLAAYSEAASFNGRAAHRVLVGPFATRSEAESARLRALQVSDRVKASVIALNADAPAAIAASVPATPVVTTAPTPAKPVASSAPKPALTSVESKPAVPAVKPAVAQAPAPTPVAAPKPVETAPKPTPKPAAANVGFAVQLGAFADAEAAKALRDKARAAGLSAFTETVSTSEGTRTRVRIGPVADRAAAEQLRAQAQSRLGVGGMVRPHP